MEKQLREILTHMADYLRKQPLRHSVWDDINQLEEKIKSCIEDAYEYNNNSFSKHPEYYIDYFEMRLLQIDELHSLHYEMRKIQSMPEQAEIIGCTVRAFIQYSGAYENSETAENKRRI